MGTDYRTMRANATRALVVALLVVIPILGATVVARASVATVPGSDPAPSTSVYPDTTLLVQEAASDTARVSTPAAPDTTRVANPAAVDFEEQRKRGDASLEQAFRGRRGALLEPLPLFGAANGSLSLPDAGSRVRTSPLGSVAEVSTDRPLFSVTPYGIGIYDLAATLDNPRADGVETLDFTDVQTGLTPTAFVHAGDLLARPAADRALTRVMPGEGGRQRRARSALYYGNGDGGVLDTGARFVSPNIAKGVAGSYARHEADGVSPLRRSLSSRYALAAGLPRAFGHTLWLEGSLFHLEVEHEALSVDSSTSEVTTALARAEVSSRDLTLHGRNSGARWESAWTLRGGNAKRTSVQIDGGRERWSFPGWSAQWLGELRPSASWTSHASLEASSRRIEYRVDQSPLFDPLREEVRASAGLRRSLSATNGLELDVAGDWRETASTLVNSRLSVWGQGGRASGRLDLEWAHERPSWVDLLSPDRVTFATHLPDQLKTLRLERSGDPDLNARLLAGGLGRAAYELSSQVQLEVEGSLRRISDDFGWNLTILDTVDTLFVNTQAAPRGDGWASYGAIGIKLRPGTLRLHGLAWIRGGPDWFSPQASSPARVGGDLSADMRITLFKGDLPLELGFDIHAQGPREGFFHGPGTATSDLSFRADFGPAGAFARFDNLFDRRVPSALYDASGETPISMPERSFQFGGVWYLFD